MSLISLLIQTSSNLKITVEGAINISKFKLGHFMDTNHNNKYSIFILFT